MNALARQHLARSAATTLALLAALTACSGGGGDHGGDTIGAALGQPRYDETDWTDRQYQVQELVAACMRDEGWEYIPLRTPDAVAGWEAEDQRALYAERGFGLAWSALHPEDVADGEETMDPNQAYAASLSEAEQEAFWTSYQGTPEEIAEWGAYTTDPDTGEVSIEVGGALGYGPGCNGEAHEAVYGAEPTDEQRRQAAVAALYEDLAVRIAADPRVAQLDATWSACMADAGFDLENPLELWQRAFPELQDRFWRLGGGSKADAPEPSPEARADLEALLADEIALAVAHYDCSEDYDPAMAKLSAEIEADYVRDHRAEIEQVAAALAGE